MIAHVVRALFCALLFALPARAEPPAAVYHTSFDRFTEANDWMMLPQCRIHYQGRQGNPEGYLEGSCPDAPADREIVVGLRTESAGLSGDYGGTRWTISVDLSLRKGDTGDVWLMFHYRGLDGWLFNGWRYPLAKGLVTRWQTYEVSFDPNWTDEQARAQGWQQEPLDGFLSPSWSTCMQRVGAVDLLLYASGAPVLGIDNFTLSAAH